MRSSQYSRSQQNLTQILGQGGQQIQLQENQQSNNTNILSILDQHERTDNRYNQPPPRRDNFTNNVQNMYQSPLKNTLNYMPLQSILSPTKPQKNQTSQTSSQVIGGYYSQLNNSLAQNNYGKSSTWEHSYSQNQSQKDKKVVFITSTSKAARDYIINGFQDIEDYDVFTVPGGIFGLKKHLFLEECIQYFLQIMNKHYQISDIYLISFLNENTNVQANLSDNQHIEQQSRIMKFLKILLEVRLNFNGKLHGIIVSPQGKHKVSF